MRRQDFYIYLALSRWWVDLLKFRNITQNLNRDLCNKRKRTNNCFNCAYIPLLPPVKRNAINDLIQPKTSVDSMVWTLPVFESGLTSSKVLPRDTSTSCVFPPEKFPWTAWVMPVAFWRVKLYKYMVVCKINKEYGTSVG